MSRWKALYVAYTARYTKPWSRRRTLAVVAGVITTVAAGVFVVPAAAWADPCDPGNNPIVCENSKQGTPKTHWDIDGAGDPDLQGFATDISVNAGERVDFKIKTDASDYDIEIYRLGYYNNDGARLIDSVEPLTAPQPQDKCVYELATQLYDCGNWELSASWNVPADAVSGVYIARLFRDDTDGSSHITFIVRQDASTSDVFYQTSDATWQAYNMYGGSNFYAGGPKGRAYKLSYNRPFADRASVERRDFLFGAEYPMIRFLERNGYDVSYTTNVDSDRRGQLIKNHKVFLSVGHDEYWSQKQRENVEAARDSGTHLAFFSGNSVYWKTRYEPSKGGPATPYRTVVTYKETWANSKLDTSTDDWTGTWRDPRFSPPADGGRPENELMGTMYMVNDGDLPVTVKSDEGKYRLWRHTDLADIPDGQSVALSPHTVGYESDEAPDNAFRPEGLVHLSTTTGEVPQLVQDDWGNKLDTGETTHHLTLYRAASGALVFSAGSIQYTWGLDEVHDGAPTPTDSRMQQSVVNLLADMGVQPSTLMGVLHEATASADDTAPTVAITAPAADTTLVRGDKVTLEGTAADAGGRVAGVEVSTDNGATWHPATGTTNWSYTFYAAGLSTQTVRVRAADDSANLGQSPVTREFQLSGPSNLFGSRVPKNTAVADGSPVELGVRFKPAADGYVTGVRFYKGAGNTGTHTGSLWTSAGQRLRTGTFEDESASGWQTLTFSAPVKVDGGTTYVASYYAPGGNYAADSWAFVRDWKNGPLTAPRSTDAAGNGLFQYGAGGGFPDEAFDAGNYYVDVNFAVSSELPPSVTSTTPVDGAGSVPTATAPSAVFSKALKPSTVTFTLTAGDGGTVTGTTAYDSDAKRVTFTPAAPLAASTSYTAKVSGADTEGRPGGTTWSFFSAIDGTVHSLFPTDAVPTTVSQSDSAKVELGVKFQASNDGELVGVRFYQGPGNTGTHQVSLWTAGGSKVDSATVASSTETGWRTAYFDSPADIDAGTTYVVSYFAPNGNYAFDSGYFDDPVTSGPLSAQGGNNGVYRYGDSEFPSQSYNSANYWVDPLFVSDENVTPSPSLSPSPSVSGTSVSPSPSATSPSASPSPSTSAPSTYGVFTATDTPATASWDDNDAVELGMKVVPSTSGKVHGVRFYKGAGNTGPHTGTLWSPGGIEMASVTFENETASGWQVAYFPKPISVTAGHQYVVSYHTTVGHYAVTGGGLADPRTVSALTVPANGATYRYGTGGVMPGASTTANFWVDLVFAPD